MFWIFKKKPESVTESVLPDQIKLEDMIRFEARNIPLTDVTNSNVVDLQLVDVDNTETLALLKRAEIIIDKYLKGYSDIVEATQWKNDMKKYKGDK